MIFKKFTHLSNLAEFSKKIVYRKSAGEKSVSRKSSEKNPSAGRI